MDNDLILRTDFCGNKRVRELIELSPIIRYKTENNQVLLFIGIRNYHSSYFTPGNEEIAKNEVAGIAIENLKKELEDKGYYTKKKLILLSIVSGFVFLLLLFILLLPFLFGNGMLAISKANRVIIKFQYSPIIINQFDQHVYYLNQGDIMIIKKEIQFDNSTLDPNYFSAIAIKEIVLLSVVENLNYPTYIIPPAMGVGIRFNNVTNQYAIDLLTSEKDGLSKRYVNLNVCENSFFRIDPTLPQFQKNYVFSKYGNIVITNSYITKLPIPKQGTLKWWTMVQSLFFDYFAQLFKSRDYAKQDETEGFDSFVKIDINSTTFAC